MNGVIENAGIISSWAKQIRKNENIQDGQEVFINTKNLANL